MTADQIRLLVQTAKLEEAIEAMLNVTKDNDYLYNNVIQLSGRFRNNEKQQTMGLVSNAEYTRTRNQITYALLEYIKELPS